MEIKPSVKWDLRFLEMAALVATWSKDPSTKVGACIVDSKRHVVSVGYNGFPRGVNDTEQRYKDRPLKHLHVCHAERNALDNAHCDVTGCTLYCTLFPCNECAKSIIQRGIKEVVTYMDDREDLYNWEVTKDMFREAGISWTFISK